MTDGKCDKKIYYRQKYQIVRYFLSSSPTPTGIRMSSRHPPIPNLHIWTKVENESFGDMKYFEWYNPVIQKYLNGELREHEPVNDIFEPFE